MGTKYFSVTGNDYLTAKEVATLIYSHYGEKAYGVVVSDVPSSKPIKQERPTMPIQFIWHDGHLYNENSIRGLMGVIEENCTVEQIGAVLYVRSNA